MNKFSGSGNLMSWIAVIPVRAGSKGVRNKNTRIICGKPLYQYTVDFAIAAGAKYVFISTDIKQIFDASHEKNVVLVRRKKELCQDNSIMSSVMLDFLSHGEGRKIVANQTVVLLQATSPFRKRSDFKKALNRFESSNKINLMLAVTQAENHALKYGYVKNGRFEHLSNPTYCFDNRQGLPQLFRPTGAFYIFKAGWYRQNMNFSTSETGAYKVSAKDSLDIDSLEDLKLVEAIMKNKRKNSENSK